MVGALTVAMYLVVDELQTSRRQAHWLSRLSAEQRFEMAPGPSPAVRYPGDGPYDLRLGYAQMPDLLRRLSRIGYAPQTVTVTVSASVTRPFTSMKRRRPLSGPETTRLSMS